MQRETDKCLKTIQNLNNKKKSVVHYKTYMSYLRLLMLLQKKNRKNKYNKKSRFQIYTSINFEQLKNANNEYKKDILIYR